MFKNFGSCQAPGSVFGSPFFSAVFTKPKIENSLIQTDVRTVQRISQQLLKVFDIIIEDAGLITMGIVNEVMDRDSAVCIAMVRGSNTTDTSGRAGLRRGSAADRLLGFLVRIPPEEWMFVFCVCCTVKTQDIIQDKPDKETSNTDKVQRENKRTKKY